VTPPAQTIVFILCDDRDVAAADHASISIRLSPEQVEEVLRAAASLPAPTRSMSPRGAPGTAEDGRLSRSLVRGLGMLAHLGRDGRPRRLTALAAELQMSPSTAHRYAQTLLELGLLERCPRTRRYRLAERAPAATTPVRTDGPPESAGGGAPPRAERRRAR